MLYKTYEDLAIRPKRTETPMRSKIKIMADDIDPWRDPSTFKPPPPPQDALRDQFNMQSFDTPYKDRTLEFYLWRQGLIEQAPTLGVSDAAKFAAAALEDYYEQLLAEKNYELEAAKTKLSSLETTLASRIVATQQMEKAHSDTHAQWGALATGKDEAMKDLQAEIRRLSDENTALKLQGLLAVNSKSVAPIYPGTHLTSTSIAYSRSNC